MPGGGLIGCLPRTNLHRITLTAPPASGITNPARNYRRLHRNTDADSGICERHADTAFSPPDLLQGTTVPSESQNELPAGPAVDRPDRAVPPGRARGRRGARIEVHILPKFGSWALADITAEEVGKWERQIMAQGFARRTARDARTTLTTIINDAIPRHIKVNPAARKRGKGRKGQRRIERHEQAEKVWATPFQVLLISVRLAALTGRDEDFLFGHHRWLYRHAVERG